MLEAFLETVAEREKVASAEARNLELLSRLPDAELLKIANGETVKEAYFDDTGAWLDKYKDSPLLQEAIILEKACLQQEMERRAKQRDNEDIWREDGARRDELDLKRRLLDLQLAEADVTGDAAGDQAEEIVEEAGGTPEQAEEAEEEAEEAGEEAAVDLGKAAAAIRLSLTKEAVSAKWVRDRVLAASSKASPSRLAAAESKLRGTQSKAVSKIINRTGKDAAGIASSRSLSDKALVARDALKGKSLKLTGTRPSPSTRMPPPPSETRRIRIGATSKELPSTKKPQPVSLPETSKYEPMKAHPAPSTMKSTSSGKAPSKAPLKTSPNSGVVRGAGLVASGAGVGAAGTVLASRDKAASISPEREQQIKEAFGAALMAGLKGMKSFAGAAGKTIGAAGKSGGLPAAGQAAMNAGRAGAMRAGKFISKNPAAGAAMIAAPAAAAGYAAG